MLDVHVIIQDGPINLIHFRPHLPLPSKSQPAYSGGTSRFVSCYRTFTILRASYSAAAQHRWATNQRAFSVLGR